MLHPAAHRPHLRDLHAPPAAIELLRRLDWALLAAVAALIAMGLWAVSGVTSNDVPGDPSYYVVRQALWVAIGLVALMLGIAIDPIRYQRHWKLLYATLVVLLAGVLVIGREVRGSRRWLDFGSFQFQPSEFGKLLVIVAAAGFIASRGGRVRELSTVLTAVLLALGPAILLFLEPDLGTSLVYGAAVLAVLLIAGARWLHLGSLVAAGLATVVLVLAVLPAFGVEVLAEYQRQRIAGFLNSEADPTSVEAYNVLHSKIAMGAGGLSGRGEDASSQTNLNFLPEHRTDFIAAAFGEQRGFVGVATLLLLYLFVIWRMLGAIPRAPDLLSASIVGGIAFAFLFQVFVNVGMTMGIAPVTGIPLPFVSVGGSAMIASMAAIGVVLGVRMRGER
jgi:rod shape determining protein RodA